MKNIFGEWAFLEYARAGPNYYNLQTGVYFSVNISIPLSENFLLFPTNVPDILMNISLLLETQIFQYLRTAVELIVQHVPAQDEFDSLTTSLT